MVRLASFFGYSAVLALLVIFAVSGERFFEGIAVLLILFLLERIFHIGQPERKIAHLDKKETKSRTKASYNVALYLAPISYRMIEAAFTKTTTLGGGVYLQLLSQLVHNDSIARILLRLDVSPREFLAKVEEYVAIAKDAPLEKDLEYKKLQDLLVAAFAAAKAEYSEMILPGDLFGALVKIEDQNLKKIFNLFDLDPGDLASAFLFAHRRSTDLSYIAHRRYRGRVRVMNRAWTARPTPFLDRYSEDVTSRVRAGGGGFLIGHQEEYEALVAALGRPDASRAMLIGEVGSGKSAIIDHLAFAMVKDHVPQPLFDKRLVSLSLSALVAGASEAQAQERISKILEEISRAGNVVLHIPDIHQLLKTGGEARLSGVDILLPAITSGDFSVVGSTTPREYAHEVEAKEAFAKAFEPVRVSELSSEDATRYLVYAALVLEPQLKKIITFGAIKEAVKVAKAHFHESLLPGSAENLLKEAAGNTEEKTVTADEVIAVAKRKKHIALGEADTKETEKLLNLEEIIHERFIDQEIAVRAVANALREYRSGLSRKGGPIASFLFVGPTGVGKTELAKLLSEVQFGSKEAMARFDMSEYQDSESVRRLLGSADGEVLGSLTERVRVTPYTLVLLDEFEKANKDILNIFLQVLDDGRLTDGVGRVVDFTNTIIIATSNAHAKTIQEYIQAKKSVEEISQMLRGRLSEYFKPELINRFSDVIIFKSLSPEDLAKVAKLNLAELSLMMSESHGVELVFEQSAVLAVARLGYDPAYGARPMRRVISDKIRSVLAEKLLRGEIAKGGSVRVLYRDEAFIIE